MNSLFLSTILAQSQVIPIILMVGVMVLIFFVTTRSQRRKDREHKEMLDKVKAGDEIISIGGIHGVVHSLTDETVFVKVDEKVKIELSRGSIRNIISDDISTDDREKDEDKNKENEYKK